MQYSQGNLGRAFVLRIDDGEDLIESLKKFVKAKGVESCMALFIGALKEGRAVTGPELM
jgi:predicted DNA-binding protein with PD1-like motif